ncbi:hypothetical protein M404DRAFT_28816 [Pisolithus tinctorius Marx 270]|uniref:Uncharacterized protein n=1 Tax=Pisolithus tinctorius Marx 270 TaxID=870435 RepID=A0A0C3IWS9_PISTI|nr:hypothetical protein M404DRAFT_28816 [Pisolithus tinctorius Marx 270]
MPGPLAAPCLSAPGQASKSTRSGSFTLEEIINNPEAEIKDVETARILLDQLYTVQGELSTPEHISHTLFYISQSKGVNNTIRSAIHATAYLVRELTMSEIAEAITRSIADKIETSVIATISPQIAKILTAANLEKTNKNVKLLNDNIARNVESITTPPANQDPHQLEEKIQELIMDMGMIKLTLEDMKNQLTNQISPTTHPMPYKDALNSTASNSNQIPLGKWLSPEYAKAHAAIKE